MAKAKFSIEEAFEQLEHIIEQLSEEEVIEAGTSLLQIAKLLLEAVQENPELQTLISAQIKGDF